MPIADGAPLRMRIERKPGYKQPKYAHTLEIADGHAKFGRDEGGFWKDDDHGWYGGL